MTAIARTTAFQVKTTSMPSGASSLPIGPRGAQSISRIRPVATGGMTSGSDTSVSTSSRPRKRPRASSHASARPGRIIAAVAAARRGDREQRDPADLHARQRCSARGSKWYSRKIAARGGAAQEREEPFGARAVPRLREHRRRIDDARRRRPGDDERQRGAATPRRVRLVDDRGVDVPVSTAVERGAHVRHRHDSRGDAVPQPGRLRDTASRRRRPAPPQDRRVRSAGRRAVRVPPRRRSAARPAIAATTASWLPSRSMRVSGGDQRRRPRRRCICASSALMNRSTGAPLTICRASTFEPAKLKRTSPPPASRYATRRFFEHVGEADGGRDSDGGAEARVQPAADAQPTAVTAAHAIDQWIRLDISVDSTLIARRF